MRNNKPKDASKFNHISIFFMTDTEKKNYFVYFIRLFFVQSCGQKEVKIARIVENQIHTDELLSVYLKTSKIDQSHFLSFQKQRHGS